jgi:DNA-binding MarR family transcriptional regulator
LGESARANKIAQAMIAQTTEPAARRLTTEQEDAWRGFLRVHAAIIRRLDSELQGAHDLPLSSYDVLLQLAEAPERRLRMADLAQSVLISPSGLTRMVDRLVREGLVERQRCPSDARGTFAVLTAAGLDRLRESADTHLDGVRRLFLDHLSEADLRHLAGYWERLLPDGQGR